jgi:hypothetical protein
MPLDKWDREPGEYRVAAVFRGDHRALNGFLQDWLQAADTLDLPGAWMAADGSIEKSVVLWPHAVPPSVLIRWMDDPERWGVFYQAGPSGNPPPPNGVYAQWGYQCQAGPVEDGPPRAIRADEFEIRLPAPAENVFEMLNRGPVVFVAPGSHPQTHPARLAAKSNGRPYKLTLSLVPDSEFRRPSNREFELARIKSRMHQLEQQKELLEWQAVEYAPPSELLVYRETERDEFGAGTHWQLRRWFVRAPDADIRSFTHMRTVVQGLSAKAQALHLVRARSLNQPPQVELPDPAYVLHLDPYWYRRGRQVYVPRGTRLQPAPPPRHERVVELLEHALWQSADPARDALLLLQTTDQGACRFTVPVAAFTPLEQHVDELNFAVAMNPYLCDPPQKTVDAVLEGTREAVTRALEAHIAEMRQTLGEIWSGDRADLNLQRSQVGEALRLIQEIRTLVQALSALRSQLHSITTKDWSWWDEFVGLILSLDRELLPGSRGQLESQLRQLDDQRAKLSGSWRGASK